MKYHVIKLDMQPLTTLQISFHHPIAHLALTGCAGQGENSRGLPGWAILLLLVALIVVA